MKIDHQRIVDAIDKAIEAHKAGAEKARKNVKIRDFERHSGSLDALDAIGRELFAAHKDACEEASKVPFWHTDLLARAREARTLQVMAIKKRDYIRQATTAGMATVLEGAAYELLREHLRRMKADQ